MAGWMTATLNPDCRFKCVTSSPGRLKWHTQVDGEFSSLTVTTTGAAGAPGTSTAVSAVTADGNGRQAMAVSVGRGMRFALATGPVVGAAERHLAGPET